MYMMTLTELGRGALNSYIHLQSSISFLFLRLPLAERERERERERESAECAESKNTTTRFIVSPPNI